MAAKSPLLVSQVLVVLPVATAVVAIDAEAVVEQRGHDSVRELHLHLLVALGAWQVLVLFIAF